MTHGKKYLQLTSQSLLFFLMNKEMPLYKEEKDQPPSEK